MQLDHLAVVCADLDQGSAWVAAALGVPLEEGGKHPHFGTHNRLLGLGEGLYLEVIAPDPAARAPSHPRWFGLDGAGTPCLGNWIVRLPSLSGLPDWAGAAVSLARGALSWTILVPPDGSLPMEGGYPTVISWGDGVPHPAGRLPDRGVRLLALDILHPQADELRGLLADGLGDARIRFVRSAMPSLRARFATPDGERVLA